MEAINWTAQDRKFGRAMRVLLDETSVRAQYADLDAATYGRVPMDEAIRTVEPMDSVEAEMCATDDAMVPFDKFHAVCQALEASEEYADVLQGMYRQKAGELATATTQLANCALTVAGFKTQGDRQVSEAWESGRAWKCGFWIAVCFGVAMTFVATVL